MSHKVKVIGGGLAGCEAAWQLARLGTPVALHEMRPLRGTEAHLTGGLAELVCSNSFRSDDAARSAIGLLHEEMRRCGSLILAMASGMADSGKPRIKWSGNKAPFFAAAMIGPFWFQARSWTQRSRSLVASLVISVGTHIVWCSNSTRVWL